jgi:oligopeptide transport system substrate-binding protein
MWKLLMPLAVLLAVVVGVLAIDRPRKRADVVMLNGGDASTLDVTRVSWQQDNRIVGALWEGLVRNDVFDPAFGKLPGMAERWEVAADGKTWTFHIRANTAWSNGAPFTAGDFVFSWQRGLLPDTPSDYQGQLHLIKGAREFTRWRTEKLAEFAREGAGAERAKEAAALWAETQKKFDDVVKLKAVDDWTLVMELERPVPYWLDLCAFEPFYPIYRPLVEAYQSLNPATGRIEARSDWTRPPLLVTNGPFKLVDWKFKREMRLEKSEHYWNRGRVGIDSISIAVVEDRNAQVVAFQTGAVDFNTDLLADYRAEMVQQYRACLAEHASEVAAMEAEGADPITISRRLPADPRLNVHPLPAFGTYFYNFNCLPKLPDGRENPFFDPRVRRAFSMAVDRKNITENVRRCGEVPSGVLVPRGSIGGYASPAGVPYDPEAARKLLAEAGYPGGKGFITVEILFNRDMGHDLIAEAVKKDWESQLGVTVTLKQKEIKIVREDLKKHDFIVARGSWFGDYGDPLTFLETSRSDDGNNDRSYNSKEFDALLEAAGNEADPAKRLAILKQAEERLLDDSPLLPVFQYVEIYMFDPHKLTGVSPHPRHKQQLFMLDVLGDGKGPEKPVEMKRNAQVRP